MTPQVTMGTTKSNHSEDTSDLLQNTQYDRSAQALNQIMTRLRDCGTEQFISLPKIAVVGNQSAGKSSLIEAISQIKVPRAAGTCTRCPMEVILRRNIEISTDWRCKISLRKEYDEQGDKIGTPEIIPFGDTKIKEEVTALLRGAQLANLNPHMDPKLFTSENCPEINDELSLQFSKNVVVLEIFGANVDVTFIDLPGIISNVEKEEDEGLIGMVENLVKEYVSQSKCLILLTISMKDDIENQSAARKARTYDRHGERTIGALTKPDTIQNGEHESWLRIYQNKAHGLKHGWYVTRNCSPEELSKNLSWEKVRQLEKGFFQNAEPWQSLDNSRLGTPKLVTAISNLLSSMIRECLPEVQRTISTRRKEVDEQLARLPEPFTDQPQIKLLSLCTEFIDEIRSYAIGEKSHGELFRKMTSIFRQFRKQLHDTVPTFDIVNRNDDSEYDTDQVIDLSDAEDNSESERLAKHKLRDPPIYLDTVSELIESNKTRELPTLTPFAVDEYLMGMAVSQWEEVANSCFEKVEGVLQKLVFEICDASFQRFKFSGLHQHVRTAIEHMLDEVSGITRKEIRVQCTMEKRRPFTMNEHYFIQSKSDKYSSLLKLRRPPQIHSSHGGQLISKKEILAQLALYGFPLKSFEQLTRLYDPDKYEEELRVISEVLAYFKVAYKRMIDAIPMRIEHHFVHGFLDMVKERLISELGLIGENGFKKCAMYVADNPDIQAQREDLLRQRNILINANEILGSI